MVRAKNTANSKVVTVKIVDACGECEKPSTIYADVKIDLSKGAFEALTDGNTGLGRIPIEWFEP
jgi:rare lipoprotein A (peptidoglycan hydrolase)